MDNTLNKRLQEYFSLTAEALSKVKLTSKDPKAAKDLLDLAHRYYSDAQYFEKKGDLIRAYGAVCYAHCFLDCGARLGLFDVDGDSRLFMVDEKEYD